MFKQVRYFYRMSRPINVLIALMTILIAAFVTGEFQLQATLYLACITAAFMTSGANIVNDIFDVAIDRINKPRRLLPSELISIRQAWIYFYLSYALALLAALLSGWSMFLIAALIALLLYLYSAHLKRTILWGNLTVSFSTAIAFIYGAMAVGAWKAGIIPAVFAFLFHFGREIVKDMQDVKGDLADGAVTFPGRYGMVKAIILINITFLILIVLTIIPYILDIYSSYYLWVVLFGVDTVLIASSLMIWFRHDPSTLGKISHLLKLDMLVGLVAIYLGGNHVIFLN